MRRKTHNQKEKEKPLSKKKKENYKLNTFEKFHLRKEGAQGMELLLYIW